MNGEISLRLSTELKKQCVDICDANGLTLTEAVKAFVEWTTINKKLPFESGDASQNLVSNVNNTDKGLRIHLRFNDEQMLNEFKEICDNNCLSYSLAIKAYLNLCIKKGEIICEKNVDSNLYNNRQFARLTKNK